MTRSGREKLGPRRLTRGDGAPQLSLALAADLPCGVRSSVHTRCAAPDWRARAGARAAIPSPRRAAALGIHAEPNCHFARCECASPHRTAVTANLWARNRTSPRSTQFWRCRRVNDGAINVVEHRQINEYLQLVTGAATPRVRRPSTRRKGRSQQPMCVPARAYFIFPYATREAQAVGPCGQHPRR